ncbi:MAG: AAA family ATPase [Acidobacteria bacterium]|nr:AAA family ATPase [Acidobacteriota bacterium]
MSRFLIRQHFNLPVDPWAGLGIDTADSRRIAIMVRAAVRDRAFVSIAGPRGSGKTHAVSVALHGQDVQLVELFRLDRERLHMGDIATAIVRDLSDERPRRSGEARDGQVRRILGTTRGAVVVLIDDAHLLHGNTLRALKRLRELPWQGRRPLCGVVLVSQRDATERIDEVRLRSTQFELEGLRPAEVAAAVGGVLGELIEPDALELLSRSPKVANWLDMQFVVDQCLEETAAQDLQRVGVAVIERVVGKDRPVAMPPGRAPVVPLETNDQGRVS